MAVYDFLHGLVCQRGWLHRPQRYP